MKLGHYKIWPDNCCKTWSGICCKGCPKNYCKVWFKKLQKSAQKCCKESKCDQYLLWILRTVSIGYNFDWNFGLEIVAEFGRENIAEIGREKFGRKNCENRPKNEWERYKIRSGKSCKNKQMQSISAMNSQSSIDWVTIFFFYWKCY